MATALQIDPDRPIAKIVLPADPELRSRSIATRLSDGADRAVYHREALMWVHGNGSSERLPPNLLATALASAWRGIDIGASYFLHGRVIVTAAEEGSDLRADLADQAFAVADVVADRVEAWRTAPPASNEAAWAEIIRESFARIRRR